MTKHFFDIELAAAVGIEAAILAHNVQFWIDKNKANKKHFYENRYWTYNSVEAWATLFPYMTRAVIRKRLDLLVEKGLLIKGNFNDDHRNRTNWYSIDIDAMHLFTGTNGIVQPDNSSYTDSKHTDSKHSSESSDSVTKALTLNINSKNHPEEKKKKEKKKADTCFQAFTEVWCEALPLLGFSAVSGQKINQLIQHSRDIVRLRNAAPEDDPEFASGAITLDQLNDKRTLGIFKYIMAYAKRSNHWAYGKSITTFESKYREIFNEIIHGKSKQTTASTVTGRTLDFINNL